MSSEKSFSVSSASSSFSLVSSSSTVFGGCVVRNKPLGGNKPVPAGLGLPPIGETGRGDGRAKALAFGLAVVVVVVVVVLGDVRANGLRLVEIAAGLEVFPVEPAAVPGAREIGGRLKLSKGFPRRREFSVVVATCSSCSTLSSVAV